MKDCRCGGARRGEGGSKSYPDQVSKQWRTKNQKKKKVSNRKPRRGKAVHDPGTADSKIVTKKYQLQHLAVPSLCFVELCFLFVCLFFPSNWATLVYATLFSPPKIWRAQKCSTYRQKARKRRPSDRPIELRVPLELCYNQTQLHSVFCPI